MQTDEMEGLVKSTQFPEAITPAEAEKLWFQDETVQKQKKVYSLDQIWRFLSVKINHTGLVEEKIRALDNAEHEQDQELEEFTDSK